ncbi:polyphosphate kinase 1 [Telluria aromaticivorans]|uniref:Polyphosphate kinase n=1 Tax=Telluria aromaticivorans TaxID=2725995 RepID=A0A7Y2K2T3_9BURK|nr:polyphosphate kinase 1 [Telluria aromaticivorans]NNG25595.1 polyphosphate kinase 1 [Telluria aromaticivorans]
MDKKVKDEESEATPLIDRGAQFLNRELSLLEFNRRVLAQAEDERVPLLERLRFLCIVSSNLDEFFEVRVASLLAQHAIERGLERMPEPLAATLLRASEECRRLIARQYGLLNSEILPRLSENGIHMLRRSDRNPAQKAWVKQYFDKEVRPLLTPVGLDPAHPFPRVINKSLNFIVELSGKDAFGRGTAIAIMKVPRVLPRVIRLPDELSDQKGASYCLLSSVIQAHLPELFTGREVVASSQFRVTRNSDLWVDEEEVKNLRQALQSELHSRQYGFAVRLEVGLDCPAHLSGFLSQQFGIDDSRVFAVDGPVNMGRLLEIVNTSSQPELKFAPYAPGFPAKLNPNDIFGTLARQDVLLHHPFQSFQPVLDFIHAASSDPNVVAIKQTIYRAGMNSELVEALISAAQRGKEVTVIVELMARFDEEANINWAEKLEAAGAQVVYGVVGLKTHAKMALVLRREASGLRRYAHLGTGNYNPATARHYSDIGLLTSDASLTADVNEVFIHLTSMTKPKQLSCMWLAPFSLQKELVRAILQEGAIAREGKPGRIIAKMNSLTDETVIRALYDASCDGVKIDLIVRGACSLRPGVPGLSANIKVRSIVGRFLEHTRIFYFRNNLKHDIYLSSADWMNRNLLRRIEITFPVSSPALKKRLLREGLQPYLNDNVSAWELDSNGQYRRRKPRSGQKPYEAQKALMEMLGASASEDPQKENEHGPDPVAPRRSRSRGA